MTRRALQKAPPLWRKRYHTRAQPRARALVRSPPTPQLVTDWRPAATAREVARMRAGQRSCSFAARVTHYTLRRSAHTYRARTGGYIHERSVGWAYFQKAILCTYAICGKEYIWQLHTASRLPLLSSFLSLSLRLPPSIPFALSFRLVPRRGTRAASRCARFGQLRAARCVRTTGLDTLSGSIISRADYCSFQHGALMDELCRHFADISSCPGS